MADLIDKTQEDLLRQKARKLIAASQPAVQVAHMLVEDGMDEQLAVDIAYNAKIILFRPRLQRAMWGIVSGAIVTAGSAATLGGVATFFSSQYFLMAGLILLTASIGDYIYCRRQIRLAENRLRALAPAPLAT